MRILDVSILSCLLATSLQPVRTNAVATAPYNITAQTLHNDDNHKGDQNHRQPKAHETQVPEFRKNAIDGEERVAGSKPREILSIGKKYLVPASKSMKVERKSPQVPIHKDIQVIINAINASRQRQSLGQPGHDGIEALNFLKLWKELNYSPIRVEFALRVAKFQSNEINKLLRIYEKMLVVQVSLPNVDTAYLPPSFIIEEDVAAIKSLRTLKIRSPDGDQVMRLDSPDLEQQWKHVLTNWKMRNYSIKRLQQTLEAAGLNKIEILKAVNIYLSLEENVSAGVKVSSSHPPNTYKGQISSVITDADISIADKLVQIGKSSTLPSKLDRTKKDWMEVMTSWALRGISRKQIAYTLRRAGLQEDELSSVISSYDIVVYAKTAVLQFPELSVFDQINSAYQLFKRYPKLKLDRELPDSIPNSLLQLLKDWDSLEIPRIQMATILEYAGFETSQVRRILSAYSDQVKV
ncbi:uncharacterized protein PHALS_10851 [Plasmopara halstedii]|uniref:RxLR-like protein n=1 Tax=Plasmopara halstedii TaxID=4781 RepID=A0A0P1AHP4_PLAHL|nr:uncharacterized protein PHALS_10851 [Plasmopara halstedii]CEG40665.1 hypothetical protein PHALS_10851 [Plasmopara halstedii]|eukprot:XP_024577034.1 hypothetical protein PHALS_10851 [Plasmopara halstedii]